MCEHDAPDRVKRARGQIIDEQAVVIINIGRSDVVEPNTPVERVILPDDSLQAQRICNIANAVLNQQKTRVSIGIFEEMGNTHQHRHREDANRSA
jgi:hypothetical protein